MNEDAVLLEESQEQEGELAEDHTARMIARLQWEIMKDRRQRDLQAQQAKIAEANQKWDDWATYVELNCDMGKTRVRARVMPVREEVRDMGTQTGEHDNGAANSTDDVRLRGVHED